MNQANALRKPATPYRKRHRFNGRMTRIVLLISFLFFFGRLIYSSIGAWYHHQDKIQQQQLQQQQSQLIDTPSDTAVSDNAPQR